MNRYTRCAQAAGRHRRLARQLHRCERRRLADRPALQAALPARLQAAPARANPPRPRSQPARPPGPRGKRPPDCDEAAARTSDAKGRCHSCCVLLLLGRREAPSLRRLSRRREGGSAAMGKDGVAAPQARSVTRAPRPPSSVQRSCLTELLGSRFAHCAAVGRRGYCRPAASSSAAARGSWLQYGT